jgi:hypothetical protein
MKGGLPYTLVLLINVLNTHATTENEASHQGQKKSFYVGLINSLRKLLLGILKVKVEREDIPKQKNGMGTKFPLHNTWILPSKNIHIQVDYITKSDNDTYSLCCDINH